MPFNNISHAVFYKFGRGYRIKKVFKINDV